MEDGKSETKLNFRFFIKMALQKKISWDTLLVFLDDLTPTLVQSKQAIEVLVKELQTLQSKVQEDKVEDDEIVEIVDIINSETLNVSIQNTQSTAVNLNGTKRKSTISQLEKDVSIEHTDIRRPEVVSQIDEVNPISGNCAETYISEKEFPEATEVIQLDDYHEGLPNPQNDLSKDNENGENLSFQINGEDCSIEFEESNTVFDLLNVNDLQVIDNENVGVNQSTSKEITIQPDIVTNQNSSDIEKEGSNITDIQILSQRKEQESHSEPLNVLLLQHERTHTGTKPFQCKTCSKRFSQSAVLKRHERTHTGEKPFQCKTCLKRFSQSVNLKIHERIHTGERPFECKTCSKRFSQSSDMKRHERRHTGEKPFQCKPCSKNFAQLSDLKRHETIHTGEKLYHCKTCNTYFSHSATLKRHEKVHTSENPFQCKICYKCFSESSKLEFHEGIHIMKKKFKCETCLNSFSRPSDLKRHKKVHTGETPFQCRTCYKYFSESSKLEFHEGIHTIEKKFKCKTCSKSFSTPSELKRHERTHTGEKPFQCKTCLKSFGQKRSLQKHEKRIHIVM